MMPPSSGTVEPTLFANGRINTALALYRECKAAGRDCKLEVSGGDALHTGRHTGFDDEIGACCLDEIRWREVDQTVRNAIGLITKID